MLQLLKPSTRAKAKTKMAKARINWNWTLGKAKAKRRWYQFRINRKRPAGRSALSSGLIGGAAGVVAIFAVTSAMVRRKAAALAQSGQAPSRSHVQRSSHPAAQSRFEPVKRIFGLA